MSGRGNQRGSLEVLNEAGVSVPRPNCETMSKSSKVMKNKVTRGTLFGKNLPQGETRECS